MCQTQVSCLSTAKTSLFWWISFRKERLLFYLLKEIKESIVNIDLADDLTVDQFDEICARLEQRIEYLNEKVEETKKVSPNPAKQERRTAKKYLKQTRERKQKNSKYNE